MYPKSGWYLHLALAEAGHEHVLLEHGHAERDLACDRRGVEASQLHAASPGDRSGWIRAFVG